ncbi:MAG: AAA family ATPase [Candidatus Anammoximicrobium sp.]|nr:AAA family ATPase [Candidatus Anammoximicrobium sp.]
MKSLYEQFRPRTWDELVGQDKLTAKMSVLRRRGLVGRVFWVTGDSGTGKTTVARLVASEIADDYAVVEIDAQDLGMDRVREFERMCQFKPLGKGCHVFICNEAHGLSSKVVSRLQTLLEQDNVQRNSTWIFTTTFQGERKLFDDAFDACPFMSRAIELTLEHGEDVVLAFAVRARKIAQTEQLDGKPLDEYVRLVRQSGCNMRKVLQRIEAGEMLSD